jgi:hypothetical protein
LVEAARGQKDINKANRLDLAGVIRVRIFVVGMFIEARERVREEEGNIERDGHVRDGLHLFEQIRPDLAYVSPRGVRASRGAGG